MSNANPLLDVSKNRLLARLPETERRRLLPLLKPVTFRSGQALYESRGPIDHAYFPTGVALSALVVMQDGNAIEVATIGNEGVAGYIAAVGGNVSPYKLIVQVGDGGLRIEAATLREEVARSESFRELLIGYHGAFMAQLSQSVACNGLHRLEQRCCRWLLMTRDRIGSDEMRLSHEFLAIMLGARRASVTEALRPLQAAGLVRSHRGLISIIDRVGLEGRSCECYQVVKDEYDRLLGDRT